jgi:NitT/TauT family transport system substrate-binding protein
MKKSLIRYLIVVLILSVTLIASAESPQNTVVRIGHLPIPGQVLYYIAQKEGYFKEQGLEVQLSPITSSVDILNALNAGKFDLASAGTAAPLTFISKGVPFIIVGGLMGEGTVIQVNADSATKIHSINDFKGKKIATVRLATGDVILRGQLAKHHLLDKVELVEFKSPTESLLALKTGHVLQLWSCLLNLQMCLWYCSFLQPETNLI